MYKTLFNSTKGISLASPLCKLDNKKSSGYDDISVKFLKLCKSIILKPLVLIFNKSVLTGEYPDELKIAKVIPLSKVVIKLL